MPDDLPSIETVGPRRRSKRAFYAGFDYDADTHYGFRRDDDTIVMLPHMVTLTQKVHRGWLNKVCRGHYDNQYEEWYFEFLQDAVLAKLRYG
jgi:hypothetical protein